MGVAHVLDGAAHDFRFFVGACVPVAAGNQGSAFESLIVFLLCLTVSA